MAHPHLSSTAIGIVLAAVAGLFYGVIVLYGAWIDGKRQKVRDKGKHPVTKAAAEVHAREDEER
ncbi:MAG TPA: hypothetical protein VGM11_02870 [Acidobacteriaceae bacterium]|jgi:hypothetical protein